MEQKKIRLSLIFSSIVFGIGVCSSSIVNYFFGYSVAFLGTITLFAFILGFILCDKVVRKRIVDLLILTSICLFFVTILYCVTDWSTKYSKGLIDFVNVFSNIYSIISLICLIYGLIRIVAEYNGKSLSFVEAILSIGSRRNKNPKYREVRRIKEVENGDLEQKPADRQDGAKPESQQTVENLNKEDRQEETQNTTVEQQTDNNQNNY